MTKITKLCVAGALMLSATTVAAQSADAQGKAEKKAYPHMFVGVQGGYQTTFTDFNNLKLATRTMNLAFGGYFTPVVGARLHLSGWRNKGGFRDIDATYNYKYATASADLLLNVTNLFCKNPDHLFNIVLIGGIGANCAWDNDDVISLRDKYGVAADGAWEGHRFSHNARVGLQLGFNLSKHWDVNLEVTANNLSDRYNSKRNATDDWQGTGMLGVTYKFGHKKKERQSEEPIVIVPGEPTEQWATRTDTIWYEEDVTTTVNSEVKKEGNFFFELRRYEKLTPAVLDELLQFIKQHPDCQITVTGYADKGTGTPTINMRYARLRAERVARALKEAGIEESRMTVEAKGDTEQPFAENDKNRVTVVTAKAMVPETVKKGKEKKFRTEEVRYKVN